VTYALPLLHPAGADVLHDGGGIHVLLVIAIIVVLLIQGRKVV
jgi:hypothetical protein